MQAPFFKSSGKFLSIQIDSSVNDEKLEAITHKIHETAATFGKLRLIVFYTPYASLNSAEDLYDDLRFVKLCADRLDKVAVIAEGTSKRHWTGLFSLFSNVPMEFFPPDARQAASTWIQNL
ncbi:MAG: STAS/SEC14 domain-containing protein [Desulfobacterales bacterium]|jgi:hypothetical protein